MIFPLFFVKLVRICCAISPSNNPLYKKQYYIHNNGSIFNGIKGEDLNVVPAWEKGFTGEDVHIIVISDGCQANHTELEDNFNYNMSFNYENNSDDPSYDPRQYTKSIGTKLATIAAGADNEICGIGIAYNSIISCINVLAGEKAQKNIDEGIKRDKNVNKSIRIFPSFSQFESGNCHVTDFSRNDESFFKTLEAIFVTSSQGSIKSNEDLNYLKYTANPYILTFGEISQRGGRTNTSIRGNSIIGSVVTGGCDYLTRTSYSTAYISTGDGFDDTCSETVLPTGTGGAMASGVISLILSAAPTTLYGNDISVIIALTSVKNDPYSNSWKTNKKGIRYSSIYGFGRLDSESAVNMAMNYTHKSKAVSETAQLSKEFSLPISVPTFLSGYKDIKLENIDSTINYIDFIELIIYFTENENISDYSLFRIIVISPSGTERLVKDVSPISEPSFRHYRITSRDFFGEEANGTWTVRFLRENVGQSSYRIEQISIEISGYEDDDFPLQSEKVGSNPFQSYNDKSARLNLELPDDSMRIVCGKEFNFTVEFDDDKELNESEPFDLVIVPFDEDGPFEPFGSSFANVKSSAKIDCFYRSNRYKLRAVNPVYMTQTNDIEIELENYGGYEYNEIGFDENQQYRIIKLDKDGTNGTKIPIDINRNNRQILSNYKVSDSVLATLWNIETNKIFDTQLTTARGGYYVYKEKVECKKCVLTVVPLEIEEETTSKCNTFVNTLSILDESSSTDDHFTINWNDVCPVPNGIKTPNPTPPPAFSESDSFTSIDTFYPTESYTPPTRTPRTNLSKKLIIIIVVCTCVAVAIIIFLIFCQLRKKIGAKTMVVTEQTLNTTPLLPS